MRGRRLRLEAYIPRAEAASDVTLELNADGVAANGVTPAALFPMSFARLELEYDVYEAELSPDAEGLYFYRIIYESPEGKKTVKNSLDGGENFQLTVYSENFRVPESFKGGIIYQIFPDRFARSDSFEHRAAKGKYLRDDWYGGVPKYPEKPGDEVDCNDFFGGDLLGVAEKLDYITSLGANYIYLNPIFEAHTNHRYDTGDYMKVDSMLGGEEALDHLLAETKKRGVGVILDGVFSHTGSDSRYFNKEGNYPTKGAYSSPRSRYADWYTFRSFPDDYLCWWGVKILPELNKKNGSVRKFFCGTDGVAARYVKRGAAGWRLDVVDELPDDFINELRSAVKRASPEAVMIGEVWEDASNKVAYGRRRRYFSGGQLDSVMNYPLREAIIAYVNNADADSLYKAVWTLYSHYPKFVSDIQMNLLGTHDTVRILNLLGSESPDGSLPGHELAVLRLTPAERERGLGRLRLAYLLCALLPGVPSIYYGDEAGMEGWRDPFNRLCFPWGRTDDALTDFYRKVGAIRRSRSEFADGSFEVLYHEDGAFVFRREETVEAVNRSEWTYTLVFRDGRPRAELLSGQKIGSEFRLEPDAGAVIAVI